MRTCLKSLLEILQKTGLQDDQQIKAVKGYKRMKKLVNFTKFKILRYRSDFISKLKRIGSRLKIHGFSHFRRKWLTFPNFSSKTKYRKLEKDISLQHN
ncbi:hypothetical protein K7X08_023540 [Anisodus acutangulus]|uniref:Uncharacterized protein n=1 Tax=Anisodus acutangulus TaxID=402998 RepID=A0A9Q1L7T9_9SOLA|nr:hypothetical protein K7X08_023540 [Anisodus acutangulus]